MSDRHLALLDAPGERRRAVRLSVVLILFETVLIYRTTKYIVLIKLFLRLALGHAVNINQLLQR